MKKVFAFIIIVLSCMDIAAQNVGIGTTTPAPSALLDISSTTKGFLPPRMTIAQRDGITSPVAGLQIWCIDCNALQVYDGTFWQNIYSSKVVLPNIPICSQVWMNKNLNVSRYRNGDVIPQVTDNAQWVFLTTGAWCWYNNDSATYAATYGKLYNWYAVNDSRGLAPTGWHIPSDFEWTTLENCLGGVGVAGGKMKETGTLHWLTPNTGATNSSGFTGLPGGCRKPDGQFDFITNFGYLWSSTAGSNTDAWARSLVYSNASINRNYLSMNYGISIRCIKD